MCSVLNDFLHATPAQKKTLCKSFDAQKVFFEKEREGMDDKMNWAMQWSRTPNAYSRGGGGGGSNWGRQWNYE